MRHEGMTQTSELTQTSVLLTGGVLQRKCDCGNHTMRGGECEACSKEAEGGLQRKASGSAEMDVVPPIVHEVLRTPGRPLDATTRAYMEPRIGYDFSQVRVHTDAQAEESAQAVSALAYTVERDIVFNAGQYMPHTRDGQKLL